MPRPIRFHLAALAAVFALSASAADVGVRIRFGLTDTSNGKWDGTVTVAPGQVLSIDGWRFQQLDKVDGTSGWKADTRPLIVRCTNVQK